MSISMLMPYIRLGRFHKPIGAILLYLPCLWGLGLCSLYRKTPKIWEWAFIFLIGAFCMRAAGCIINDIFDRHIDKDVARTKIRPLASGELNVSQALIFAGILSIGGLAIWLFLNPYAKMLSFLGLVLLVIYPLMKRFFPFPQLVLGFSFNIGILIAVAQLHPALLTQKDPYILYLTGIFWTLYYDTIYAVQDVKDDVRLGVHSTAVFFQNHIRLILFVFYGLMSLTFAYFGYLIEASWGFYGYILFALLTDFYELRKFHLHNEKEAARLFMMSTLVGAGIAYLIFDPY